MIGRGYTEQEHRNKQRRTSNLRMLTSSAATASRSASHSRASGSKRPGSVAAAQYINQQPAHQPASVRQSATRRAAIQSSQQLDEVHSARNAILLSSFEDFSQIKSEVCNSGVSAHIFSYHIRRNSVARIERSGEDGAVR